MNYITLKCSFITKKEFTSGKTTDGRVWQNIKINVAQNESVSKKVNGQLTWEELPPKYWNLTIWGKDAEMINNMDIPAGTKLLITGKYKMKLMPEYTSKKTGETYPAQVVDDIDVEQIAILITGQFGRTITIEPTKGNSANKTAPATKPQNTSAPAPIQPVKKEDDLFGNSNNDDIFGATSNSPSFKSIDDDFDIFG